MHPKAGSTKFSHHCVEVHVALISSMENIEHMVVTVISTYIIPDSMKKPEKHADFQITLSAVHKA